MTKASLIPKSMPKCDWSPERWQSLKNQVGWNVHPPHVPCGGVTAISQCMGKGIPLLHGPRGHLNDEGRNREKGRGLGQHNNIYSMLILMMHQPTERKVVLPRRCKPQRNRVLCCKCIQTKIYKRPSLLMHGNRVVASGPLPQRSWWFPSQDSCTRWGPVFRSCSFARIWLRNELMWSLGLIGYV